jgi:hypothetical protein
MAVIEGTTDLKTAVAEYDFSVDGGAISTITLRPGDSLGNVIPTGSVIVDGYLEVDTQVTAAAGGTIAVQCEGANDLVTATIFSSAPWNSTGRKSLIPLSGATSVKTTAQRNIKIVIAVGAVSAGKFRVVLIYR